MSGAASSDPHRDDHFHADAIRIGVGVLTVIGGVIGLLQAGISFATGAELPAPLESLFPIPALSRAFLVTISACGAAGGVMLLRRMKTGVPLCSGSWATVAAVVIRPAVRFNYADGADPTIRFPVAGTAMATFVLFAAAAALTVLTHAFGRASRHATHKLTATVGEVLTGTFFLTCGLVAAITLPADAAAMGDSVYRRALAPLLVATLAFEIVGLGILAGWALARAAGIACLLALAGGALFPDLLLDHVQVDAPVVWAPICAAGGLALLWPRRHEDEHHAAHHTTHHAA